MFSMWSLGGVVGSALYCGLMLVFLQSAKLTVQVLGSMSTWRYVSILRPAHIVFILTSSAVSSACLLLLSSLYPNPGFPSLVSLHPFAVGTSGLEGCVGLLLSGVVLGAVSALQFLDKGLHVLSFPSLQRGRIFQLKSQSLPSLVNSLAVGLVAPLCYFLLFVASYLSSSSSASPTTGAHSLPQLLPLSFRVLLHVYATAVVVVFTQRMVLALMHIVHTQWVSFEGRGGGVGAEGDVVVPALEEEIKVSTTPGEEWKEYKAGATSLMGALALMELSGLVRTSPRRRARIFADHTGGAWESVLAHTIGLIDSMTQRLLSATQEVKDERKYSKNGKQGVSAALSAAWNSFCRRFLIHPPARKTEALLADYSLTIWSIQALAGLVAASREEDRFGVVQRSDGVRRTLHSLLALDLALEAYCALPLPLPKPPASTTLTSQGVTRPHPHAITVAVENGVYQVVTAFYDHLPALKFPPAYARKLQSFADFQQ